MFERVIYTIGTSNRSIEEFIGILKKYQIATVIDVRSFPKSTKFPYFNRENLREALEKKSVGYFYLGDKLGGFRKEGYENYTKTTEFKKGIKAIEELAEHSLSVFFCAERLFFRCHRRFISDVLTQRGWRVIHIVAKERIYEHKKEVLEQKFLNF